MGSRPCLVALCSVLMPTMTAAQGLPGRAGDEHRNVKAQTYVMQLSLTAFRESYENSKVIPADQIQQALAAYKSNTRTRLGQILNVLTSQDLKDSVALLENDMIPAYEGRVRAIEGSLREVQSNMPELDAERLRQERYVLGELKRGKQQLLTLIASKQSESANTPEAVEADNFCSNLYWQATVTAYGFWKSPALIPLGNLQHAMKTSSARRSITGPVPDAADRLTAPASDAAVVLLDQFYIPNQRYRVEEAALQATQAGNTDYAKASADDLLRHEQFVLDEMLKYRGQLTEKHRHKWEPDESKHPNTRSELESQYPSLAQSPYEVLSPSTSTNCLGNVLGKPELLLQPVWERPSQWGLGTVVDEVRTTKDPWGKLDQELAAVGYAPKVPVGQVDLHTLPPGTILAYEGNLYQGVIQSIVPYASPDHWLGGVPGRNPTVPLHVAIVNEKGVFDSVLGPTGPHVLHQDPNAVASNNMGSPRYVYIPTAK